MATDDRYLDDVHYRGGCVTVSELSQYAVSQVAMNAMPPDAAVPWRRAGATSGARASRRRRRGCSPGSATRPTGRTGGRARWRPTTTPSRSPIFNIGGWHDSYVDPAFRMQARCPSPSHTLVGNWVHSWPHSATPGPNLDDLHEIVRFFDRHLNGVENGWEDEPAVVWFEHEYAPPEPFPSSLPGRWRAASAYPHPATTSRDMGLRRRRRWTRRAADAAGIDTFRHRPTDGHPRCAVVGCRRGAQRPGPRPPAGRAGRPDVHVGAARARRSRCSACPEVVVHVEVDAPVAMLSVRLSDVAPDGTSALVSAGVLNLTHRRSHADPEPLRPGVVEQVEIPLRTAGYRWLAGHRLRVALASSLWPVLWPSPHPATFRVHRGPATPSRLVLPVVPPAGGDGDLPVPAFRTDPPDLSWPSPEAADGAGPARPTHRSG